jgi:Ran GTPase-activating protein (RanGAP) involved in mRNA processing and transport
MDKVKRLLENDPTLKYLVIQNINDEEKKGLFEALKTNTSLKSISFGENKSLEDVMQFCESIKENKGLEELCIYNYGNTIQNLYDVFKINTTIKKIDILHCYINSKFQFGNLIKNNTIIELKIQSTFISEEEVEYLSEVLKTNKSLKNLVLRDNNTSFNGIKYLSEALKVNNSITSISLINNNINEEIAKYLFDFLKINTSLKKMYLDDNNICTEGVKYLFQALKFNKSLTDLSIRSNNIRIEGADYLVEELKYNKTKAAEILNIDRKTLYNKIKSFESQNT